MLPIKNLFGFRKNKGLDKSIIQKNPYRNNIDLNKRQFIKKGLLGMAGLGGLALASKVAKAGGLVFNDGSTQSAGSLEGTSILSTSETGGTKFLREDGDGTSSWQAAGGGWVELQSISASSDATVDMETGIDGTYDEYMICFSNIHAASDGVTMNTRLKIGGSYKTDAYYQSWRNLGRSGTSGWDTSNHTTMTSSGYGVPDGFGNAAGEAGYGTVWFSSPDSTDNNKGIIVQSGWQRSSDGSFVLGKAGSSYSNSNAALTGVRFYMGSGNITSGTFTLYGLTKS
jgi:hypothetical protein